MSQTNEQSSSTYCNDKYDLSNITLHSGLNQNDELYKLLNPNNQKLSLPDLNKHGQMNTDFKSLIKDINKYGTISPSGKIIDTPKDIKLKLKIHQKRTLYEMISRENSRYRFTDSWNVNLLCDNVGSGKSLCILSLIAQSRIANISTTSYYSSRPYNSSGYSSNYYGYDYNLSKSISFSDDAIELKSNLIVVPHNVFNQWKKYITNFTSLNALYISTNKIIDLITSSIETLVSKCDQNEIILIKSTMYKSFHKKLSKLKNSFCKTVYQDSIEKNQYSSFKDYIDSLDSKSRKTVKSLINGAQPNMSDESKGRYETKSI